MAELNKILLIGRLTKDPDLRYTPSGAPVAALRLAVNHTYRTKEEKRVEVLFIDVSVFGRSAETVKQYLNKGREVFIEGRLQQDEWDDKKTGQKRISYRVVADRFQFIGSGAGRGAAGGAREDAVPTEEEGAAPPQESADTAEAAPPARESAAGQEDDLPF